MDTPEVAPETPAVEPDAHFTGEAAPKVEAIEEPTLAAFDAYVPPLCADGKNMTLRAACPDCGHSVEVTEQLFKRYVAVIHNAPEVK